MASHGNLSAETAHRFVLRRARKALPLRIAW
jgi:hypothetical protein